MLRLVTTTWATNMTASGQKCTRIWDKAHPGTKGRRPKPTPTIQNREGSLLASDLHLSAASHVPPAFSRSAAFFAVVTSPANAGIANPSAGASRNEGCWPSRLFESALLGSRLRPVNWLPRYLWGRPSRNSIGGHARAEPLRRRG